jgi:hypothetical protein
MSPAVDTAVRARSEARPPSQAPDAAGLHGRHQTLMRAYQARYVVLPPSRPAGSILGWLDQRYDPAVLAALEAQRPGLEQALIAPLVDAAIAETRGADVAGYAADLQTRLRIEPETAFTAFLRAAPNREAHYRDFLLQSSADLLAEASASAFGVIGAFGAPQSALFRILIDEFGYGAHARKHSVLYQAIMRDFGLDDAYDAYAPLFDTPSLELHNTIHFLFQNPRNVFLQVGFLLFAETAYQRSTADHFRYLREFHPDADARYFGEHAHIDLHHTRMVIDEVAAPLVASYGAEAGARIVAGAELTRAAFARAGAHLLAAHRAFAEAVAAGEAEYRAPVNFENAQGLTPGDAARLSSPGARIQVGGLGAVSAAAFARFPDGAYGRLLDGEAAA